MFIQTEATPMYVLPGRPAVLQKVHSRHVVEGGPPCILRLASRLFDLPNIGVFFGFDFIFGNQNRWRLATDEVAILGAIMNIICRGVHCSPMMCAAGAIATDEFFMTRTGTPSHRQLLGIETGARAGATMAETSPLLQGGYWRAPCTAKGAALGTVREPPDPEPTPAFRARGR